MERCLDEHNEKYVWKTSNNLMDYKKPWRIKENRLNDY